MGKLLLAWFLCLAVNYGQAQAYGYTICTSATTYKALQAPVADLQLHLSKALNSPFSVVKTDSLPVECIALIKAELKDSAMYKGLSTGNSEGFLLRSDGKKQLQIIAYSKQGLTHGIYTYLDKLGFRWYKPGNDYAVIPKLKDIRIVVEEVQTPDMQLRTFFGTFGTPRNAVVDKSKQVDKSWKLWMARNRMGGTYTLKGHAWNPFLWRHVKELQAHPEYLALVNGERKKVGTAAKFCISNAGFRRLFVADMLKQLQQQMEKSPGALRYIVSVEPSDGEGFCTCNECKKLGGISNSVFMLANETAKAFREVSAVAYVNLYAYNKHAAPPAFDIEPNVIVQLIPYKYQGYATGLEMIKGWQAKTQNLFMYDYYGLPLTNMDMPLIQGMEPERYAERVKFWHEQGIKGVTLESSYSTEATGLGLYLFARLGWNKNEHAAELVNAYYQSCYGSAAETIRQSRKVLADVSVSKSEACHNAGLLIKNLKLPTDSLQRRNIADYKAYLHYLKLLYTFKAAKADVNAKADELMNFVYGTWHRMIVHPFAISDFLLSRSKAKAHVQANWNYLKVSDKGPKFTGVVRLSDEAIEKLFQEDLQVKGEEGDVEFEE